MAQNRSATAPLIDQREIGTKLRLPWAAAKQLLTALGVNVIPAGTPRRWFVRKQDWQDLVRRLRLDVRGAA